MMFKTLALAALAAAPASVSSAGCYPTWRSGGDYSSGSYVSATVFTETTARDGTVTTKSKTKNFKCLSGSQPSLSHCPTYDPAGSNTGGVWSDEGKCSGTEALVTPAPTPKPTHAAWSGAGCPKAWVNGGSYDGGDVAEVDGVVYQCSTAHAVNLWCGKSNYKPGDSLHWEQAWTLLGSCDGTIAPTTSPNYQYLADHGGCPNDYAPGTMYEGGDKVTMGSIVYQCRPWPNSGWCSMNQYEPGGVNSNDAWTILGYCEGTMAPTSSPAFSSLEDIGGCPLEYASNGGYEAGDKVSLEGNGVEKIVYECKSFPDSGYCNQYEPGHWSKLGWMLVGYCEGTIAPTSSPAFSALADHNGCPSEYDSGADYESLDKVSVPVTADHSVVYQCDSDVHNWKWCNQYEPGNDWALGWKLIGYCEGTIAPTSSPNFSSLDEIGDGCPKSYNVRTSYETGDQVSLVVSNDPSRAIIYECKSWPMGAYCNAGPNYSPESINVNMGWTLKGYCDGTIAPTAAPVVYTPAAKCRWYNGTQPITIDLWAESDLSTYISGTRVRKADRIYKCRGWPNGLWCKMAAYEPEETDMWRNAWSSAGACNGMFEPTTSPTASPTSSPTVTPPSRSPSSRPSTSPSISFSPSLSPSDKPSISASPSKFPSLSPSDEPSASVSPSKSPTKSPSASPSKSPSTSPTSPSKSPSASPSKSPSVSPTARPTCIATFNSCTISGHCCSGTCKNNVCCAKFGYYCSQDSDCCSDNCVNNSCAV